MRSVGWGGSPLSPKSQSGKNGIAGVITTKNSKMQQTRQIPSNRLDHDSDAELRAFRADLNK